MLVFPASIASSMARPSGDAGDISKLDVAGADDLDRAIVGAQAQRAVGVEPVELARRSSRRRRHGP